MRARTDAAASLTRLRNCRAVATFGIALLLLSLPVAVARDKASDSDLADVEQKIAEARDAVAAARKQEDAATRALRESETALAAAEQALAAATTERDRLEAEAKRLAERKASLDAEHAGLLAERERQLVLRHRLAVNDRLRSVLDVDSPSRLPRVLAYFEYIERARRDLETRYAANAAALSASVTALAEAQAAAIAATERAAGERESLLGRRKERAAAVAQISKGLQSEAARVAALTAERKELKALLARIARQRAAVPAPPEKPSPDNEAAEPASAATPAMDTGPTVTASAIPAGARFGTQRGRLGWPVQGRIRERFGKPRAAGQLTWDGLLIAAAAQAEVRAVHAGTVVFAGWLRGFGELTIVDHGDGFLTLYGHLARSARAPGERLGAGDVLGAVGSTGGLDEPALYFEIRAAGEPVDPARWLRKR